MEYEDAAPVCCLGRVACGGELPVAEGTCANSRAGLNLLFFLYKWQKLTFGSAGAHLEHILASCWYYPWVQDAGESPHVCLLTPFFRTRWVTAF